jgi:hypothetical protein
MKSLIKTIFATVVSVVLGVAANHASAQTLLAGWATESITGTLTTSNTFAATTTAPGLTVTTLTKGSGISPVTTTSVFGGNNWTNSGGTGVNDTEANAIAGNHFISYTVQAAPGYTVSFTTNVIFWHNSATGPWNGELQYSTDGINYTNVAFLPYTNGNFAATSTLTNNLSGIAALQNVPATVTNFFRLVNWGATGSAGTWYINNASPTTMPDFQVIGAVTPVPPSQSLVAWYVNGLPVGAGGAPPAYFTNNFADANLIVSPMTKGFGVGTTTSYGYYGGNGWTNAGIADSEASSISNGLYIAYSVQAAPGYTVSFFTNLFYAYASSTGPNSGELQYSTDGTNYTDIAPIAYAGGVGNGSHAGLITNNLSTIQALQNVPSTVTNFFRIVNWGATSSGGTWYIYSGIPAGTAAGTNEFAVIGGVNSLLGVVAPTNLVVSPPSVTVNAGQNVSFTVTQTGSPASNFWYEVSGATTNLIPGVTASTLTLSNVLGANSGSYFVVLTNASGSATSSVVTLSVVDPIIQVQPNSAQGLAGGTVQFTVGAVGTSPFTYQWYEYTSGGASSNVVNNGTLPNGSVISGATGSTLTIANLQAADLVNLGSGFFVVVSNADGSSVASSTVNGYLGQSPGAALLSVTNVQGVLAFWDFDGSQFTNTAVDPNSIINPVPFIGTGTAFSIGSCYDPGTSPFSGSVDPFDVGYDANFGGYDYTPFGFYQLSPNFSWGVDNYPASGSNKLNGVQFNVSTVGAKNITVSYDCRVSSTASDYQRLQYTTNGTDWIDYPASSTFNGGVVSTYYTFSYNLAGFPGVDNNPNFGVRIVTEFQSTATYGVSSNTNYLGAFNGYGTTGTVTYDLVAFQGDAITNSATPPTLSFAASMSTNSAGEYATNMSDVNSLTLNFGASSSNLTFTVAPVNMVAAGNEAPTVAPSISPVTSTGAGSTNYQFTISFPSPIPDPVDAAPILVTATDTNGNSTASWFLLTVTSLNQPPTNSLTSLPTTNLLANTSLTIPFTVGSARNPFTSLTYAVTSDNNTVIPSGNVVIGGNTNAGNPTLTITPAANQVGNAILSVTVSDNDPEEPRSTTAKIAVMVRPNTNVVAIDYFNYDNSGSLDSVGTNNWTRVSGVVGQMQVSSAPVGGTATVTQSQTENLQTKLLHSPYETNGGAVLYASCTVNVPSGGLPINNGSYFACFNDGTLVTADVEGCLVVATNGAANGDYRLGIANVVGATALTAQMFPQDLSPNTTYTVIVSLVTSNGFSTLWVSPTNQASSSVTDTTPAASATNLYNISDFELRQSGSYEGTINVGNVLVGTAFNSVFYPPQANSNSYAVTENSGGNLLSPLPIDGGSDLSLVSVTPDGNGTATLSGTNIVFTPVNNFVGVSTIGYTILDDVGNSSSSTITVMVTNIPPLANPVYEAVAENSVNNLFSPLVNDVVETSGGSLGLVSVSETDGNGTATVSGTNVMFTPTTGYTGIATINYTITDGIGGTNSSLITVGVGSLTPIPLSAQLSGGNFVLTWTNSAFSLQTATNVTGPYITVPGATSPYTNLISTNPAGFFRLVY